MIGLNAESNVTALPILIGIQINADNVKQVLSLMELNNVKLAHLDAQVAV